MNNPKNICLEVNKDILLKRHSTVGLDEEHDPKGATLLYLGRDIFIPKGSIISGEWIIDDQKYPIYFGVSIPYGTDYYVKDLEPNPIGVTLDRIENEAGRIFDAKVRVNQSVAIWYAIYEKALEPIVEPKQEPLSLLERIKKKLFRN